MVFGGEEGLDKFDPNIRYRGAKSVSTPTRSFYFAKIEFCKKYLKIFPRDLLGSRKKDGDISYNG